MRSVPVTVAIVVLILVIAALGLSSCYSVDQTELANVRRFGQVQYTKPIGPGGPYFKLPFVDTVDKRQVTLQTLHVPPFEVLTIDNQKVTIEENFNYTIAPEAFHHVMYEVGASGNVNIESQLVPVVKDRTARIFAGQNMVTVNAERERIQAAVEKNVIAAAEGLFGITAHSLQIAKIEPSVNFMHSIDDATMAKNQAIKAENDLRTKQFEAQQIAATAKGKADGAVEEARGQSESQTLTSRANATAVEIVGLAQAKAIRAQAEALRTSPEMTEYTKAVKWNGQLPQSIYAGAPIPFMSVGK